MEEAPFSLAHFGTAWKGAEGAVLARLAPLEHSGLGAELAAGDAWLPEAAVCPDPRLMSPLRAKKETEADFYCHCLDSHLK